MEIDDNSLLLDNCSIDDDESSSIVLDVVNNELESSLVIEGLLSLQDIKENITNTVKLNPNILFTNILL